MDGPADTPSEAAEWWVTSDVAAYLGVGVATVSAYRSRGQMPEPDQYIYAHVLKGMQAQAAATVAKLFA